MKIFLKIHNKIDFYLDKIFVLYIKIVFGVSVGENCRISRRASFKCLYGTLKIGENCIIEPNVRIKIVQNHENRKYVIEIKPSVFIGYSTIIDAGNYIEIGQNSMIGPQVFITDVDHKFLTKNKPIAEQGAHYGETIIGNNVWVCSQSQILRNSYVADNSVVGANTTVNKKFEEDSLIIGVPSKLRKKMFT